RAAGYYCYNSGSIVNFDTANHAINNCCTALAGWYMPPHNYLWVTVRTLQPNTVMLCQLGTHSHAWIVTYGDCMYTMNSIQNNCWWRDNGRALSRGGEGYIPFGNGVGLDARWDPNNG